MTDAQEPNEIDGPHEGPIKTPRQLILAIFFSFVVPIIGIVLLVIFVTSDPRPSAGSDVLGDAAIDARLRPVGRVEVKDVTDMASMQSGAAVYAAQCTACHTAGVLGSPKLGDAAAWTARIKSGYDALLLSALAGKGQMPAQGGGDFTDFEIGRAVVYLTNQSGGKLAEPAPPVAGASAPAGAVVTAGAAPLTVMPATPAMPAAPTAPAATAATAAPAMPMQTVAAAPSSGPPSLYTQNCAVCHVAGVAGSPKLTDKAAWAPRIAQGIDALTASVIKGRGAMPPRGGSQASDADIKAVVVYMVNTAK